MEDMEDNNIKSISKFLVVIEHSVRVAKIAYQLAIKMNLHDTEIFNVFVAALLHDVGKFNLDQDILNIPTKLTKQQYSYIQNHAIFSWKLIENITNDKIRKSVLYHHERIDGSGYYKTKTLDINTKILAIADVYDALTYTRCYREKSYTHNEAINKMRKGFDNEILDKLDSIQDILGLKVVT